MLELIDNGEFANDIRMHEAWLTTYKEGDDAHRIELLEKRFVGLELNGHNLAGALMSRCRFVNCTFRNCNLIGVNFMYSTFENCAILYSMLNKIELHSAYCIGIDLEGSNLSQSELYDTVLMHANLANCDLRGAEIHGTDLRYANLENLNLDYARSFEAKIYNVSRFKAASLKDFIMKDAFLDFSGTENQKSDLDAISYLFDI